MSKALVIERGWKILLILEICDERIRQFSSDSYRLHTQKLPKFCNVVKKPTGTKKDPYNEDVWLDDH